MDNQQRHNRALWLEDECKYRWVLNVPELDRECRPCVEIKDQYSTAGDLDEESDCFWVTFYTNIGLYVDEAQVETLEKAVEKAREMRENYMQGKYDNSKIYSESPGYASKRDYAIFKVARLIAAAPRHEQGE